MWTPWHRVQAEDSLYLLLRSVIKDRGRAPFDSPGLVQLETIAQYL